MTSGVRIVIPTLLLFIAALFTATCAHDNAELIHNEILVDISSSYSNKDTEQAHHRNHHHHHHHHNHDNYKDNDNDNDNDDEEEEEEEEEDNVYHQVEAHHKTQEVYPIVADMNTVSTAARDLSISADSLPTSSSSVASSKQKTTLNGNDDGTISSTNSNRTPDFSLEASPHVQVNLFCVIDHAFCSKVAGALQDAAKMFNDVVNIKNDLLIQATYYSFCEKGCANDTFGWGAPSSQFTLPFEDGADLNYIYPQALAKQLAPYSNTSAWANHDIALEINHDIYMNSINQEQAHRDGWNGTGVPAGGIYYFKDDSSNIASDQIDLRYIMLHEILHGVGFLSSWAAYFANAASPFRALINGIIDPDELQLVTPSPFWFIKQQTGPIFVTGFQPTMIFDKFLYSINPQSNRSDPLSLAAVGFDMQNFCVQDTQSFVINFIQEFNRSNQSRNANRLWTSMSEENTLSFHFPPSAIDNSSYNTNSYLNETYKVMRLLTGDQLLTSHMELSNRNFRLGIAISHLDENYSTTPDFLMTGSYIRGQSIEDIVQEAYKHLPTIYYNVNVNNTDTQHIYQSPIGPGVLRILDSMGYSTVLSNTNYTTAGNVKSGKMPSVCDDKNNNHAISKSKKNLDTSEATPASSNNMSETLVALWAVVLLSVLFF